MTATRTRVVGTCKLIEPVGIGAMGEVWRARQEPMNRDVAVKVMLASTKREADSIARFRREAQVLALLQHENIVVAHDLIEKNNQLFMIMEFIDGLAVSELLEHGPLPVDVALLVAGGVAAALEHAHFRNVVHRDVKPANIMISRKGQVKLTDFGLAKDFDVSDMTATGMLIGTPAYVSPEQVAGKTADHRSDIYSLGVVLYSCLTGKKPFKGSSVAELFSAIARGRRPRLREVNSQLPRWVEGVVDRCMQLDPSRRFPRAGDVRRELNRRLLGRFRAGPEARLVAFLEERGYVDDDDLTYLNANDVRSIARDPPPVIDASPSGSRWRRMVFGLAIASAVVGALAVLAPDRASDVLAWLRDALGG